jgi:hypothetical protein
MLLDYSDSKKFPPHSEDSTEEHIDRLYLAATVEE